jgi:Zn ribbon nucleic-acid-binding protein
VIPKRPVGTQERARCGHEQDYPGAYQWPLYAVRCPECKEMVKEYGEVSVLSEDGHEHFLCVPCGEYAIRMSNEITDPDEVSAAKVLLAAVHRYEDRLAAQ